MTTEPAYRIADELSFTVSGRRVVVVVEEATNQRMAFYQSSGRNGGAAAGAWCPFHGWRLAWGGVWFIKRGDGEKLAQAGTWQAAAAAWLATAELPQVVRTHDWRWASADAAQRRRTLRCIEAMNDWLGFCGVPDRAEAPRLAGGELATVRRYLRDELRAQRRCAAA